MWFHHYLKRLVKPFLITPNIIVRHIVYPWLLTLERSIIFQVSTRKTPPSIFKPRESETITPPHPPHPRSKPTTGFSLMASNTISFLQIPISTSQFCNEKPHNSSLLPLPLSSFYGNKLLISHSKLRNLSLKGNKPSTNVTVLSTLPTK